MKPGKKRPTKMASTLDEQILRATKEIVVKFVETGRISPTNFQENFNNIYQTIRDAVKPSDNQVQDTSD